jgi:peptidyl-prolyl cis-trans isomerase D
MLKTMRTNKIFTFVILVGVTVIITIAFVFWGIGPKDNENVQVLAQVDKQKVSFEEYWRAYDNAYKREKDEGVSDDQIKKLNLKEKVLQTLVDRKVLLIAAERSGITVTEKELQDNIIKTPYFKRNGVFDKAVYERALRLNRMTPQIYEATLRNDLVINKMIRLIGETSELTEEETGILKSLGGGNVEQLREVFRANKSNLAIQAYVEGYKKQLDIKVNRDLIS